MTHTTIKEKTLKSSSTDIIIKGENEMTSTKLYIIAGVFIIIALISAWLMKEQYKYDNGELGNCHITFIIGLCCLLFAFMLLSKAFQLHANELIVEKIRNTIDDSYVNVEIIDINVSDNTYDD